MTLETAVEPQKYEELRWLTDVYMQVQKLRVANGNRVFASTKGLDSNLPDPFVARLVGRLEDLEKATFEEMKAVVRDHPAWPWLDSVKGIGPTIATKILGLIGDIEKFATVSKLWMFSGYGLKPRGRIWSPEDALYRVDDIVAADNGYAYLIEKVHDQSTKLVPSAEWSTEYYVTQSIGRYDISCIGPNAERQRPIKGEKLSYNRRLKTAVYLAGDSFIKSRSPYRDLYDASKKRYRIRKQITPLREILRLDGMPNRELADGKKEWDALIARANKDAGAERDGAVWTDGHVDNAARRYMAKIFLSHLWEVWREAEGLTTRPPYALEYLDHETYLNPWHYTR